MKSLVSMAGAKTSAGDVIEIVHTLNLERHVTVCFDESKISPRLLHHRELDNVGIEQRFGLHGGEYKPNRIGPQ